MPPKAFDPKEALVPDGLPKKTSSVPAGPAPTEFGAKRVGVIEGLIMWHEPQKSAAVLAAGLGFFTLTIVFQYSYTALASMSMLVHLLVSSTYAFVQHWNNKRIGDWTSAFKIDKDEAAKIGMRVAADYNKAVDWYFSLCAARDLSTLGTVLAALFGAWTVSTFFSDDGLVLIGFVLAFAVPLPYYKNKPLIDKHAIILKEKILAAIPRQPKENQKDQKK